MLRLFAVLKIFLRFLSVLESKYFLGSGALAAAVIAAVLYSLGVSEDAAVTTAASLVAAVGAILARFIYRKADDSNNNNKNDSKGEVLIVKVTDEWTRASPVVWYKLLVPIAFKEAAKKHKFGADADGNVYNLKTGELIGETRERKQV